MESMFSELCNSYSCSAEANVFVVVSYHIRYGREILSYELSENAVAFAMQYAHLLHVNKDGVVNEIFDSIESFVTSHAAHIKVVSEVTLSICNGVECLS